MDLTSKATPKEKRKKKNRKQRSISLHANTQETNTSHRRFSIYR